MEIGAISKAERTLSNALEDKDAITPDMIQNSITELYPKASENIQLET